MTNIEWVKNPDGTQGITLNSKTGCLNHTPEGLCFGGLFPCYAFKLANGRLKYLYMGGLAKDRIPFGGNYKLLRDPFYPHFWPERLEKIRHIKKPTGIFLDDMSDWMGDYWPEEWTRQELQVMRDCPQHRFYTLTKQPQRLPEFSPFPDNCWVGVTATRRLDLKAAFYHLGHIEAKVKYLSLEPLLEEPPTASLYAGLEHIDWLIIGACTGSWADMANLCMKHTNSLSNYAGLSLMQWGNKWTAQPKIEWVREIVEAADKAGVKVFLKDNLEPLFKQGDIWAIPEWAGFQDWTKQSIYTTLRQELPNG